MFARRRCLRIEYVRGRWRMRAREGDRHLFEGTRAAWRIRTCLSFSAPRPSSRPKRFQSPSAAEKVPAAMCEGRACVSRAGGSAYRICGEGGCHAWPTSTQGGRQPSIQPLFNRSAGLPMPSALIKYNRYQFPRPDAASISKIRNTGSCISGWRGPAGGCRAVRRCSHRRLETARGWARGTAHRHGPGIERPPGRGRSRP